MNDYPYDEPVEVEWVKMLVKKNKLDYYAQTPNYFRLYEGDSGSIFAFRRPVNYRNEALPHHLELCNMKEISDLEEKRLEPR